MLRLVEIGPVFLEKIFKKIIFNIILLSRYYLPLLMGVAFYLNNHESPLNDVLCQVWLKLAQWSLERKIFKYFEWKLPFRSSWRRTWPFIWTNLNSPNPSKLCASLVEIGRVVLERKIFQYFQYNFTFSLLYPLGKGGPWLEHTWILSIQGCFVLKLVEIGPVVLEKKIFKYFQ